MMGSAFQGIPWTWIVDEPGVIRFESTGFREAVKKVEEVGRRAEGPPGGLH